MPGGVDARRRRDAIARDARLGRARRMLPGLWGLRRLHPRPLPFTCRRRGGRTSTPTSADDAAAVERQHGGSSRGARARRAARPGPGLLRRVGRRCGRGRHQAGAAQRPHAHHRDGERLPRDVARRTERDGPSAVPRPVRAFDPRRRVRTVRGRRRAHREARFGTRGVRAARTGAGRRRRDRPGGRVPARRRAAEPAVRRLSRVRRDPDGPRAPGHVVGRRSRGDHARSPPRRQIA